MGASHLVAIETATDRCSVAIRAAGEIVIELALNRPRSHAEQLVPLLADALRYAGLEPRELDAVAVSSGPGSYTGLRIGASTAKGLAVAVGAELVPVPSLEALAYAGREALSTADVLVSAFDARRDEVFAAAYQLMTDGSLDVFRETAAIPVDGVAAWLGPIDGDLVLAGNGGAKIAGAQPESYDRVRLLPEGSAALSAAWVARLGARRHALGQIVDPTNFEPYYLKDFVAKLPTTSAFEKLTF